MDLTDMEITLTIKSKVPWAQPELLPQNINRATIKVSRYYIFIAKLKSENNANEEKAAKNSSTQPLNVYT